MAKVTLIFAVLLIALGLGVYLGTGSKASHRPHSDLVWPGSWHLRNSGHESQRKPPQALYAHQRDHRAARLSGRGGPGILCDDFRPYARPDRAYCSAIDGWSSSHLRDSVRALLHRGAPREARSNVWAPCAAAEWVWACAPSARRTVVLRAPASPTRPSASPT